MSKKLDLNDIARFEKAIAKKYGPEAIENPRKYWNDEKEKSYQAQIKEMAKKERQFEEKDDKVEQDGFLISKKLLTREVASRTCPVCSSFSFSVKDDVYMNKFEFINKYGIKTRLEASLISSVLALNDSPRTVIREPACLISLVILSNINSTCLSFLFKIAFINVDSKS